MPPPHGHGQASDVVSTVARNAAVVRKPGGPRQRRLDRRLAGDAAGPGGHHHHARGHVDSLLDIVGDEDDGRPGLGPERQDVVGQGAAGDLVQRRERLVEQQQRADR